MSMLHVFSGVEATYSISELIGYLETYKEKHLKEYADALEVYRDDIYKWIKSLKGKYRSNYADMSKFKWDHPGMPPINVAASYNKLIANFQQMQEEVIKLDMSQANAIINNDWDWVQTATTANSVYSVRKKK